MVYVLCVMHYGMEGGYAVLFVTLSRELVFLDIPINPQQFRGKDAPKRR